MGSSIKILSLGVIAGIIIAATLLIMFVTGAINQEDLSSGLIKALAVIAIMMGAFLGILAIARLNQTDQPEK